MDVMDGRQPYRTAYHFQPLKNWMNGPILHMGVYHFFYQYNPNGPTWGDIVWGHSTSTDLINWTQQPIALAPSIPSDISGCWSGSATVLPGNIPAIFYTGGDSQNHQPQILALPENPSDPFLVKWYKHQKNPLLVATPANGIDPNEFRDPTTAWLLPDGRWRMAIGNKVGNRGVALLFTSQNFIDWVQTEYPLYYLDGTGMWECPDFFPVYVDQSVGAETSIVGSDVRHVFKTSVVPSHRECYTIGTYDTIKDVFVPDEDQDLIDSDLGLRYDYGRFYASKSFYDGDKKRRVLWGWSRETCSPDDVVKMGWSGIQGIPRTILLDQSGKQLVQWPVEEIETLRERQIDLPSKLVEGGSKFEVFDITAAQADVEIKFSISDFSKAERFNPSWTNPQLLSSQKGASIGGGIGPFGLLVLASKGLEEYTAVFFRVFKTDDNKLVVLMCTDETRSSLNSTTRKKSYGTFVKMDPSEEDISLRTLIDHSAIESFGAKGKNCIMSRVYPTIAIDNNAHLYVFNYGIEAVQMKEFRAWNMRSACVA